MKRAGILYPRITEPDNLRLAFLKAGKGKQDRAEVIAFRSNLGENLDKIRRQLLEHSPDIGHYRFFEVHDPKKRRICAASFPERVLHHAVMNICEPVLERYSIFDSYACRPGKGIHKALGRAQGFVSCFGWYLKLDIKKYFDSIDHDLLRGLLQKRFKDRELLDLYAKLLDTYRTSPGKGLPIGNLISQHLANFYLGGLDHWVKEELRVKGYLRYMDDFVLFGSDKVELKNNLRRAEEFLASNLALQVKEDRQLNKSVVGLPFLGYRVFPHCVRLSSQSRQRFIKRFRVNERSFLKGAWGARQLVRHMEPLIDFTKAAGSKGFRNGIIAKYGVLS
jgi:retron-type reverse transcriptase